MSTWSHRIVRFPGGGVQEEDYYEIKEVFYRDDGKVAGYCDATVGGDTLEGLQENLFHLRSAALHPVLDEPDCRNGFEDDVIVKTGEINTPDEIRDFFE